MLSELNYQFSIYLNCGNYYIIALQKLYISGKDGEAANSEQDPISTDIVVKCVGAMGRWQFWICFVVYLTKLAIAWHQLNIVFLAPKIDFYCVNATIDKCSSECTEHVYDT